MTTPYQFTQTSLFSPTQISGCELWLDATDATTFTKSGNNISQWRDKSTNAYAFSQATGANQPSIGSATINNLPVVSFTSAQSMRTTSYNQNFTTATFFVITRVVTVNFTLWQYMRFFMTPGTTGLPYFYLENNGTFSVYGAVFSIFNKGYLLGNLGTSSLAGPARMFTASVTGSTSTNFINQYGSSLTLTGNATTGPLNTGITNATMDILGVADGQVGEMLMFGRTLSTSEYQQIEGYLAWKWGLVANLPSNHPYKSIPVYAAAPFPLVPQVKSFTSAINYDPRTIPNCILWLDGADLTTMFTDIGGTTAVTFPGQSVRYWKDKSTSANNATNGANAPTVVFGGQNNRSILNFSSQYLNLDVNKLPTGSTSFTFFQVFRTTSALVQVVMSWGNTTNPPSGSYGRAPQLYVLNYTITNDLYGSAGPGDTTVFNSVYVLNSVTASPTLYSAWDNGNPFSSTNVTISLNTGTNFAYIGTGQVNNALYTNYYLVGQVAEVIGFNRVLSTAERQQVEAYLQWKWNLSIPSSNPYVATPPYSSAPFPLVPQVKTFTNGLFNPTSITGCQLWLDAAQTSSLILSGVNVSQWNDRSGNNRNATATGTIPYTAKINGLPALSFTGSISTYLRGSLVNNGPSITGFAVFVMDSSSQSNVRILSVASPGQNDYNSAQTAQIVGRDAVGYHVVRNLNAATVSTTLGNPVMTSSLFTPSDMTIFLNGTAGQTVATSGNFGYSQYTLGSSPTEENLVWLNGSIGEIIVYHQVLTTYQRQQIEGYLAWKWRLQSNLPSNHPFKLFPPSP